MASSVKNCEFASDSKALPDSLSGPNNVASQAPTPSGPEYTRSAMTNSTHGEIYTPRGDTSLESGEGTPSRLAPKDPTHQDPQWPEVLAECVERLISAVRETFPTRAQSTNSNLPSSDIPSTTESGVTANRQHGSTQSGNQDNKQSPPNRDHDDNNNNHHLSPTTEERYSPTTETVSNNSSRASGIHDTSGNHSLGDWEMPHLTSTSTHQNLPETPGHSRSRQSLNPPTALPPAYPSSPPDEDSLPKRVADSERYHCKQQQQQQHHHHHHDNLDGDQTAPPTNSDETSTDKSVTVEAHTDSATVTSQNSLTVHSSSTTMSRQSTEHEKEALGGPGPTVPEETGGSTPVRPLAKLHATALAYMRITLDKMNRNILKHANIIQKLITHSDTVKMSILNSDNLRQVQLSIRSNCDPPDHLVTTIARETLIPCIDHHYDNLINAQRTLITEHIDSAHLHLKDDNRFGILHLNVTNTVTEAIHNATNYWRHLNSTTPDTSTSTPTMEENNSDNHYNDNNNNTTQTDHNTNTDPPTSQAADSSSNAHSNRDGSISGKDDDASQNLNKNRKSLKQRNSMKKRHSPENCTNPNCLECAALNIVNLSSAQLTGTQILLLNRGLSFVPTASNAGPTEILRDFNMFKMKARRKLSRMINPPKQRGPNDEPDLYRKPTIQDANTTDTERTQLGPRVLEDALEAMKCEIAKLEGKQQQQQQHSTPEHNNLTRKERLTLKELASNHDLVINKADKGSTIVVRDRSDYVEEGIQHLSDENTYLPLDRDHTTEVTKFVSDTLQDLKKAGLLSPKMANFCMPPSNVRNAIIYFLKKIHKNPMGIRPIVSTVNSATANLAEFLDIYLQPIMKQLPAYLKDSTQFINEISEIPVEKDTWLVTVDVKSLYTNIPNDEGIQACYEAWRARENTDPQHPPADVLRHLLEIVLKLNTFEFDNKHYLQKFGTAMGSKLAPAYANTFMGRLEKAILAGSAHRPIYYRRFIDDIFMLWPHSEEELI